MSDPENDTLAPRWGSPEPIWMASLGQVVYGPNRWLWTSVTENENRPALVVWMMLSPG